MYFSFFIFRFRSCRSQIAHNSAHAVLASARTPGTFRVKLAHIIGRIHVRRCAQWGRPRVLNTVVMPRRARC